MARNDRERRDRRYASAARRVEEHQSGSNLALKMPEGVRFGTPKEQDQAYDIAVVPFVMADDVADRFLSAVLHAKPGELYYEQTYFQHWDVGPNRDKVCCPAKMCGTPCPICEQQQRMRQDPKFVWDDIKALMPKERQLFLFYDYNEPKKGVQLWDISYHLFGKALDLKLKKAHPSKRQALMEFFRDDDKGYDLRLVSETRSMGKDSSDFEDYTVDDFMERKEPLPDKIVDHGVCLNDVPNVMSYDDIEKLFFGGGGGQKSETRDEPAPEPRGRGRERAERNGDDRPERERDRDPDEPRGGRDRNEPTPEPAGDDDGFRIGDVVDFTYRNKDYGGEIEDTDDEKGLAAVRVEGHEKLFWVDLKDLKLKDEEPAPEPAPEPRGRGRGRDAEEPRPRGRGRDAEPAPEPRGRGRAAAADDEADKPARRGRGRDGGEPFSEPDAETPARREPAAAGRGRGRR